MPNFGGTLGRIFGRTASSTVSQTVGYAAGSAASAALAPEVQPIANDAWRLNPTLPLSPEALAEMVVQSVMLEPDAADEAAETGISGERFHRLVRVSGSPPGPQDVLSLWDRGVLTEDDVNLALAQSRLKPEWIEKYKALSRNLLTADTLAEMVVQGIMPEDVATTAAAKVSIVPEDFRNMVLLAGSPVSPQEALELWNRGIFTEDDVNISLAQSRLKPQWIPQFKQLREQILSVALAADLVLKQRIPMSKGLEIARKNGYSEDDFKLMADVNGRPIGVGQALQLARRDKFSKGEFDEVVARSDVRTQYTDNLWELRHVIPRMGTITRLVTAGEMTVDVAVQNLMAIGYDHDIAAGIVSAAKKGKTSATRNLTASMIDTLYESGIESKQWAMEALTALGYDDDEAASHLMILDARRLVAALNANLGVIHRSYTAHKYDRDTATNHLDAMGIDPTVRNDLLETWTHEREANVARLTPAQIGSALKKGIISEPDAISRWVEHGYPLADAEILAAIATGSGPVGSPTAP